MGDANYALIGGGADAHARGKVIYSAHTDAFARHFCAQTSADKTATISKDMQTMKCDAILSRKEPELLAALSPKARAKFREQCIVRRYDKGMQIVGERDSDDSMYFIERGEARVNLFSYGGREVTFITLDAGENFGELAFLDGKPRSANVVALTDMEVMIMPSRVFRKLLMAHPQVALELSRQMSAMIRRLCDRIVEFSTISVNQRLHAELLRLALRHIDFDGVARIPNAPTHAQFASRISCHREAVSRELKLLENNGVVARENRHLVVPEIDRLQEMVDRVVGRVTEPS